MKRIIILLLIAINIISCSKEEEPKYPAPINKSLDYNGSYMEGFYTPMSMNLTGSVDEIYIKIRTNYYPEILYYPDMTEQEKSIYNKYVKYYGDTLCTLPHYPGPGHYGCKFPIDNISIVADKDFDSNHPKGSELNDLFSLIPEYGYMGFIENGYNEIKFELHTKKYPLNEIHDFKLLSRASSVSINKNPSTPGDYTFTVTINFLPDPVSGEECESLVQTVIMKF